jgi:hypothetical protein
VKSAWWELTPFNMMSQLGLFWIEVPEVNFKELDDLIEIEELLEWAGWTGYLDRIKK